MEIERTYQNDDGFVVEFTGPIDVELVVLTGFDVAVWRDSESGEIAATSWSVSRDRTMPA